MADSEEEKDPSGSSDIIQLSSPGCSWWTQGDRSDMESEVATKGANKSRNMVMPAMWPPPYYHPSFPGIPPQPQYMPPPVDWRQYYKRAGPVISHPPSKKAKSDGLDVSSDSEEEQDTPFDPDNYLTTKERKVSKDIDVFLQQSFQKGLKKAVRKGMAEDFPRLSSKGTQIPSADAVLADFMGNNFPKRQDEQLAKIQATIIACASPVCNLWEDCVEQSIVGDEDELIPANVVLKAVKATVSLIGNSFNYVTAQRRENVIRSLPKTQSNLAKILTQVSKKEKPLSSTHLFGEEAMEEVSKRISILDSFRKSANTADPKPQRRFLGKGPAARGGGWLGRPKWSPSYRSQSVQTKTRQNFDYKYNRRDQQNKKGSSNHQQSRSQSQSGGD